MWLWIWACIGRTFISDFFYTRSCNAGTTVTVRSRNFWGAFRGKMSAKIATASANSMTLCSSTPNQCSWLWWRFRACSSESPLSRQHALMVWARVVKAPRKFSMEGTTSAMLAHAANNISKEDTAATPAHNYKKKLQLELTTSWIQRMWKSGQSNLATQGPSVAPC